MTPQDRFVLGRELDSSTEVLCSEKISRQNAFWAWWTTLTMDRRAECTSIHDLAWVTMLLRMNIIQRGPPPCSHQFFLDESPDTTPRATTKTRVHSKAAKSRTGSHSDISRCEAILSQLSVCKRTWPSDFSTDECEGDLALLSRRNSVLAQRRHGSIVLINSLRLLRQQAESATSAVIYDAVQLSALLLRDVHALREILNQISTSQFAACPPPDKSSQPWPEMDWLKSQGYYSLGAWVASMLENHMWLAFTSSAKSTSAASPLPPPLLSLQSKVKHVQQFWLALPAARREALLMRFVELATRSLSIMLITKSRVAGSSKRKPVPTLMDGKDIPLLSVSVAETMFLDMYSHISAPASIAAWPPSASTDARYSLLHLMMPDTIAGDEGGLASAEVISSMYFPSLIHVETMMEEICPVFCRDVLEVEMANQIARELMDDCEVVPVKPGKVPPVAAESSAIAAPSSRRNKKKKGKKKAAWPANLTVPAEASPCLPGAEDARAATCAEECLVETEKEMTSSSVAVAGTAPSVPHSAIEIATVSLPEGAPPQLAADVAPDVSLATCSSVKAADDPASVGTSSRRLLSLINLNLHSPDLVAIYSSAPVRRQGPHAQANQDAVWNWLTSLNVSERRRILSVQDLLWVNVLRRMARKRKSVGEPLVFLLLTDADPYQTGGAMVTERPHRRRRQKDPVEPEFCFRKWRIGDHADARSADIRRLQRVTEQLTCSVRLCHAIKPLDTMTIATDIVSDLLVLRQLLESVSAGQFLKTPPAHRAVQHQWTEMPWFAAQGYYSLGAFIANKLELAIWRGYFEATGVLPAPSTHSLHSKAHLVDFYHSLSQSERRKLIGHSADILNACYRETKNMHDAFALFSGLATVNFDDLDSFKPITPPGSPVNRSLHAVGIELGAARRMSSGSIDDLASAGTMVGSLTPSFRSIATSEDDDASFSSLLTSTPANMASRPRLGDGLSEKLCPELLRDGEVLMDIIFLTPLDRADTPAERVIRQLGYGLQTRWAESVAMNLILAEEREKLLSSSGQSGMPSSAAAGQAGMSAKSTSSKKDSTYQKRRRKGGGSSAKLPASSDQVGGAKTPPIVSAAARSLASTRTVKSQGSLPTVGVSVSDSLIHRVIPPLTARSEPESDDEDEWRQWVGRKSRRAQRTSLASRASSTSSTMSSSMTSQISLLGGGGGAASSHTNSSRQRVESVPGSRSASWRAPGKASSFSSASLFTAGDHRRRGANDGEVAAARRGRSESPNRTGTASSSGKGVVVGSGTARRAPWAAVSMSTIATAAGASPPGVLLHSKSMGDTSISDSLDELSLTALKHPPTLILKQDDLTILSNGIPRTTAVTSYPTGFNFQPRLALEVEAWVTSCRTIAVRRRPLQLVVLNRIREVVLDLWPTAAIEIYGSFATALSIPSSDMDLVVRGINPGFRLRYLAHLLRNEKWVESAKPIETALVPIIHLTAPCSEVGGAIDVDISFDGPDHGGLATSALIRHLLAAFWALEPLVLVLKEFLNGRGLNDPFAGGMSSYSVVLMVSCFLQHQQQHADASAPDGMRPCLGHLLLCLLDYFGRCFNPRLTGMAVQSGLASPFFPLDSHKSLPVSMDPLVLQNPLDATKNVGRNCYRFSDIQRAFTSAHTHLSANGSLLELLVAAPAVAVGIARSISLARTMASQARP